MSKSSQALQRFTRFPALGLYVYMYVYTCTYVCVHREVIVSLKFLPHPSTIVLTRYYFT